MIASKKMSNAIPTPQYVTDSFDRLAHARTVLNEKKEDFTQVSDLVNGLQLQLRQLQAKALEKPEDTSVSDELTTVRALYNDAVVQRDGYELWLLSADDYYKDAERQNRAAIARFGAERSMLLAEEFLLCGKEIDATLYQLTILLVKGHELNQQIANILRADLNKTVTQKFRSVVLDAIDQSLRQARLGQISYSCGAAHESETFYATVYDHCAHLIKEATTTSDTTTLVETTAPETESPEPANEVQEEAPPAQTIEKPVEVKTQTVDPKMNERSKKLDQEEHDLVYGVSRR